MKPRTKQHHELPDENKRFADDLMKKMYQQGKAQFGSAVKAYWFYDDDYCPACVQRSIGVVKFEGKDSLAINGFIYRERGVLIGYFLCETCAKYIFNMAKKNPYQQTPLHAEIEQNLIAAYHKHLAMLNA